MLAVPPLALLEIAPPLTAELPSKVLLLVPISPMLALPLFVA